MRKAARRLASITTSLGAVASLVACATVRTPTARVGSVALENGVKNALAQDGHLARLAKVGVDPSTGVVTISGRVPTKGDLEKAGRLVCAVKGVEIVYNDLEVRRVER